MTSDSITKDTFKIPKIGLGTYKLKGAEGREAIQDAIESGYRHIDTAKIYENETEVGEAIEDSGIVRDKIFITTKIWPSDFKRLITRTEDSLRRLKTDHVDLLLLHWPSDETNNQKGAELLNEVLQKGYTKHVGVSNFTISQIQKAREVAPIICNQVEYHPYLSQEKMLNFLREQNLILTAYRPLALGKVTEDLVLMEIAAKHKKTVSQVVLRWLLQQDDVAMIPKSSSTERQQENLDIFDFELSDAEMKLIFGLQEANGRLTNPETAPEWD